MYLILLLKKDFNNDYLVRFFDIDLPKEIETLINKHQFNSKKTKHRIKTYFSELNETALSKLILQVKDFHEKALPKILCQAPSLIIGDQIYNTFGLNFNYVYEQLPKNIRAKPVICALSLQHIEYFRPYAFPEIPFFQVR